ncbi:MAG: DMT family transporter, partial [Enterobacteriaceae bacterium]
WSGNTIVNKLAVGVIYPSEIGFFRWLFAGILLTPLLLVPVLKNRRAILPHWHKILILGTLGMAMYQSLAYYSATLTSATNMGILLSLMPLMALVLSLLLLGQSLTRGAIAGSLLSFIGVLLVVSSGDPYNLIHHGINWGDAMMLLATLSYALYSVLLKRWALRIPPLQLLYLQTLVAILVLLPLYLLSPKMGLSKDNMLLISYACLLASVLAPLLWMYGIRQIGPGRMSLFFNLVPIFTALIASAILHEQLGLYHIIGGALTLFGVLLSERWRRSLK